MTKREYEIALLEKVCAKNDAAIAATQLTLDRMRDKQLNRLAELRCQKLLKKWVDDKAASLLVVKA